MKKIKRYTTIVLLALMIGMSSCFEERDDDFTVVGSVASIPVFTIPNPLVSNTIYYRVASGENLNVSIRYFSEHVKVTQYRIVEDFQDGTTPVTLYTEDVADFDVANSYIDTFQYTVPAFPVGKRFKLMIEIETENSLVNRKDLPMQVM
jgi:hypothetical protein